MPGKPPSRGRRVSASAIPSALPIKTWLGVDDFIAALVAAGVKPADVEAAADADRFAGAAATAQGAVQAIMTFVHGCSTGGAAHPGCVWLCRRT